MLGALRWRAEHPRRKSSVYRAAVPMAALSELLAVRSIGVGAVEPAVLASRSGPRGTANSLPSRQRWKCVMSPGVPT